MAQQVKIPAAGESINSATVGQWHKANGDTVAKGEVLATIETDKVSAELEAEVGGVLSIIVPEGEEVAIGTVIAEITEGAEPSTRSAGKASAGTPKAAAKLKPKSKAAARKAARKAPARAAKAAAKEAASKVAAPAPREILEIRVPAAGESIASATIAQWHKHDGERVEAGETLVTLETDKVSAELTAEEGGVLKIEAPEGREVSIGALIGTIAVGMEASSPPAAAKEPDPILVDERGKSNAPEAAPEPVNPAAAAAPVPAKPVPNLAAVPAPSAARAKDETTSVPDGRTSRRRMSTLRRKIAAQLVQAQQTAAILTTFNEADMSAVMKLRKAVQDDFVAKYGVKLGFMSFFVKAAVQALREVPSVNARVDGDEIVQNHFYDIGIAVGTEKGLIVPVVRDADQKGFAEIEQDILDYAQKARDGKIQLEDLQGGGFTISNGGIYGSLLSTPILNPPQSGILGMHTIQPRPVAVDGQVVIRPMMYLALSYDHRLVDGKEAVTFLIRIKDCIENPTRLLLEV